MMNPRHKGIAAHGETPFDTTLFTEIGPLLWMGGTPSDVGGLPFEFEAVLNLAPWWKYPYDEERVDMLQEKMYDSIDQPLGREKIWNLAAWAFKRAKTKRTLIHCQAGLNRSGLITGAVLMLRGMSADEAIETLRDKRSSAVLCNPAFEQWLRDQEPKRGL